MFSGIDDRHKDWNGDMGRKSGEGVQSGSRDPQLGGVDDAKSKVGLLSRRRSSVTSEQRMMYYRSYFEASVDPDKKPRYIRAHYDSQKPEPHKSEAARRLQYVAIHQRKKDPKEFLFGRTPRQLSE